MNYSTLSLLSQDDSVIAVKAIFSASPDLITSSYKVTKPKEYTFKTVIKNLKKDDLVIVQCSNGNFGYSVVKITEVNVEVDFSSDMGLKWVVCALNFDDFEELLEAERQLISSVKSAEKLNKKQQLIAALGLSNADKLCLSDFRNHGFKGAKL